MTLNPSFKLNLIMACTALALAGLSQMAQAKEALAGLYVAGFL